MDSQTKSQTASSVWELATHYTEVVLGRAGRAICRKSFVGMVMASLVGRRSQLTSIAKLQTLKEARSEVWVAGAC
jgi:hypothetical protein